MCRSKAEGGQRCYTHAKQRLKAAQTRLDAAMNEASEHRDDLTHPSHTKVADLARTVTDRRIECASTAKGRDELRNLANRGPRDQRQRISAIIERGEALEASNRERRNAYLARKNAHNTSRTQLRDQIHNLAPGEQITVGEGDSRVSIAVNDIEDSGMPLGPGERAGSIAVSRVDKNAPNPACRFAYDTRSTALPLDAAETRAALLAEAMTRPRRTASRNTSDLAPREQFDTDANVTAMRGLNHRAAIGAPQRQRELTDGSTVELVPASSRGHTRNGSAATGCYIVTRPNGEHDCYPFEHHRFRTGEEEEPGWRDVWTYTSDTGGTGIATNRGAVIRRVARDAATRPGT